MTSTGGVRVIGPGVTARRAFVGVALAMTLLASAGLASTATAAAGRAAGPRAVLTLSPTSAFVGQLVVAGVQRSSLPSGTALERVTVSWGDGSIASLPTLKSTRAHRYARPGRFTVTETLVDTRGQSGRTSRVELVARPQRVYWDLFNGAGPQYQLESAALPLTAHSVAAELSGTLGDELRCTSGMAVDAKGRLWVLSYPNGCSAPCSASIQVFAPPVTQSSTPVLTLTLPGLGDDDNLAFDHRGNLWVEDAYNSAVYGFTGPFTTSTTLSPAVTLTAGIHRPGGIAVDARGDVVVSDAGSTGTHSIAVFHAPVTSSTTPTFLNGLQLPGGLIFDARGDLYASNNPANGKGAAIVRFNSNHLGSGATPSIVDPAGVGGIHGVPYGANFAWDALGNLYVADCGNEASLKVLPLSAAAFTARLAPSVVYTNPSITMIGCTWGIAVR